MRAEAGLIVAKKPDAIRDHHIAMAAAWLAVAYLDREPGPRRRLTEDFFDAMAQLVEELRDGGYLDRYRTADGALALPPLR